MNNPTKEQMLAAMEAAAPDPAGPIQYTTEITINLLPGARPQAIKAALREMVRISTYCPLDEAEIEWVNVYPLDTAEDDWHHEFTIGGPGFSTQHQHTKYGWICSEEVYNRSLAIEPVLRFMWNVWGDWHQFCPLNWQEVVS